METILTGIRVNDELHIGHLYGVVMPMVRLVNKYSADHHINIFIPDLHSITSKIEGNIHANTLRSIRIYLAAGLKLNDNVHIYRQSYVPAHSEMTWILACNATMGEMNRMTQWKEKSGDRADSTNAGVFNYPILMAADIMLYNAKYVPVGEDQFQHVELTRDIGERFNNKYGETFTLPVKTKEQAQFMGFEDGLRIRSLTDPQKKMSKSDPAVNSKIMLTDDPKAAAKKIMSATTDSVGEIQFDMFNQPGIGNLLTLVSCVDDKPLQQVLLDYAGQTTYGDLKKYTAARIKNVLEEFQSNMELYKDEDIEKLFPIGEKYANEVANATLLRAQKAIGLR